MAQPQVLVVPAPGRKVRNPTALRQRKGAKGRGLGAAGLLVNPNDPYWARRIVFGDVEVTTPEEIAAKAALKDAKKAEAAAAANEAAAAANVAAAAAAPAAQE